MRLLNKVQDDILEAQHDLRAGSIFLNQGMGGYGPYPRVKSLELAVERLCAASKLIAMLACEIDGLRLDIKDDVLQEQKAERLYAACQESAKWEAGMGRLMDAIEDVE
jgi:hypothetical protein